MPSRSMMPAGCHLSNFIGGCALLPDLVVAVLAAGASRRLGRAKQLVPVGGEPLLRRQCRCALSARVGEVVAILGCDEAHHREVIVDLPVAVQVNDEWEEGLAGTLRAGVRGGLGPLRGSASDPAHPLSRLRSWATRRHRRSFSALSLPASPSRRD